MSSAYQDAQTARDAERIAGQIAHAFQRAARNTDASTRCMQRSAGSGRGGPVMPVSDRARRAPSSASQFHLHVKKSKASGSGKAPASSVSKIKYDLGLGENDPQRDRVKIAFVLAPIGTPSGACDPLAMAAACESRSRQSKYANANTGQMLHFDTALPNGLSLERLAALAGDINQRISGRFGVPAYSGVHLDDGNFHIHSSVPLYEILDDDEGGFTLGDRIDHAKRPADREALGLPRSPAGELRALRQEIANIIADAVAEEHPEAPHLAERWRHGHLTLALQVERAAQRGDVQFVLENLNRDATKKEGPPPGAWRASPTSERRNIAISHNKQAGKVSGVPGPELITKTLVNRVIDLSQKARIDTPEGFRMLARDHGLSVHWAAAKNGEGVQGVILSVAGGPRIAGRRLGASLGVLQKKLGWAEKPEYRRSAPHKGDEYETYLIKLKNAGIHPGNAAEQAIKVTLQRLEKLEQQARKAAQTTPTALLAELVPTGTQEVKAKRERPRRRSNDPTYNKRQTSTAAQAGRIPASRQAALATPTPQVKAMNVDNLLRELQSIPEQSPPPVVVYKRPQAEQQPPANAGTAKAPPRRALPDPAMLTPHQRELIAHAWDAQEAQRSGVFDGPLTRARERLNRLQDDLRRRLQTEPRPAKESRKRFLRGATMIETAMHKQWREALQADRDRAAVLERQIEEMIDKSVQAPTLLAALPTLEAKRAGQIAEQHQVVKIAQERQYADALARLERSRPGSHDRSAAQTTISRLMDVNPDISKREKERRVQAAALEHQRLNDVRVSAPTERQRQR